MNDYVLTSRLENKGPRIAPGSEQDGDRVFCVRGTTESLPRQHRISLSGLAGTTILKLKS